MAFGFFKDKKTGPLEVTCPLCVSSQQESRLAVSSYCKKCGAYLTFDKGVVVNARPSAPPDPFADRPPQPKVEIDYKPREIPTPSTPSQRSRPLPPPVETTAEEPLPASSQETVASPADPDPHSRFQGSQPKPGTANQSKIETRDVTCFECGDTHAANVLANSTQCRECGRLISMEDREIKETWSSPIQTRGNVHIHKKGTVVTVPIQCHTLIVEGDFTGDAECSGDLIIRRNGKISGKVSCTRLLVERRAKVEFLNSVETDECRIDGLVTGNLKCRGLLALEKKAILTGNIKVGSLTVADGAKHNGQVQMGGF